MHWKEALMRVAGLGDFQHGVNHMQGILGNVSRALDDDNIPGAAGYAHFFEQHLHGDQTLLGAVARERGTTPAKLQADLQLVTEAAESRADLPAGSKAELAARFKIGANDSGRSVGGSSQPKTS